MAHTLSAKKNLRKVAKRQLYNRSTKSSIRTQIKKLLQTIDSSNAEAMRAQLQATVKRLYRAAARKVIHKNLAARKASQLTRKVNEALKKAGAPPAPTV